MKTINKSDPSHLLEYDRVVEAARYVRSLAPNVAPKIGLVCGSGLGYITDRLASRITIPYETIPHFPRSTVVGHSGELVFGEIEGIQVVCMKGRVHLYEGYDVVECIRPIRMMALIGIEIICVTNASGNINKLHKPGDFMIIKDHISFPSLAGENPLRGLHDPRFGERFVSMSNAYDPHLIECIRDAGEEIGIAGQLKEGVYAMVVGPTFETVAEARAFKLLGADAVGMSTVPEIIAAHQMGVRCVGISLLTNNILTEYENSIEEIVEHEHVIEMSAKRSEDFIKLVWTLVKLAMARCTIDAANHVADQVEQADDETVIEVPVVGQQFVL